MEEVASNLKRASSGSGRKSTTEGIPKEYLSDKFLLPPAFFKISNRDQVQEKNDELNKLLEQVEGRLVVSVSNRFDQFMRAFESFDGVKDDLEGISAQAKLSKECISEMKEEQLKGMIKVHALQR